MATIFSSTQRKFEEEPNKIEGFRILLGAHQLYNHSAEACIYLDLRTFIGYDVCQYPDSNKILIAPSMEVFRKNSGTRYFDGEENIKDKWEHSGGNS